MNSLPNPIGRKVVCVEDHFHPNVFTHYQRIPVKDGVYTISEVGWGRHYVTGQYGLSFRFTELPTVVPCSVRFSAYHFRLLEDEKIVRSQRRKQTRPREFHHAQSFAYPEAGQSQRGQIPHDRIKLAKPIQKYGRDVPLGSS
jgi:hypothetical protein